MIKSDISPEKFIETLDKVIQKEIAELDSLISKVMKGQPKVLWQGKFWGGSEQNIIGYGDLSYIRPKNIVVEWFKIGLAVQKNYISIYVNAVEDNQYLSEKYKDKLGKVKVGKSSISFKSIADIDMPVFEEFLLKAKVLLTK